MRGRALARIMRNFKTSILAFELFESSLELCFTCCAKTSLFARRVIQAMCSQGREDCSRLVSRGP